VAYVAATELAKRLVFPAADPTGEMRGAS